VGECQGDRLPAVLARVCRVAEEEGDVAMEARLSERVVKKELQVGLGGQRAHLGARRLD